MSDFREQIKEILPDFNWQYEDIRKTRKEYYQQQGWNHCCEHIKDAVEAITKLHEAENKKLIDKLQALVDMSKVVQMERHGRPDCKNCNTIEILQEIIDEENKD